MTSALVNIYSEKVSDFHKSISHVCIHLVGCSKYILGLTSTGETTTEMSHVMSKPTMLFLNRSDTNQAVQAKKMTSGWKFWI